MSTRPRRAGVVLVQPESGGRLSGGYLYNRRMADAGAWALVEAHPSELETVVERLPQRLLVADSLWLDERYFGAFERAMAAGARVGVLLHSFPSLIARAERGQPPPEHPTPFECAALRKCGIALVVGPHYVPWLDELGVDVRLCSPGVADEFRAPARHRTDLCRFVSLAAQSPRKGLLDVARCLRRLGPRRDFTWTVVGSPAVDPDYAKELERAVADLPVRLLGQQPPTVTAELLRKAHVLLMPSYDENHPLVLLESMAAGVPAIAYAAGAVETIIEPPRLGWVVPIGDERGLEQSIRSALDDEPERFRRASACEAHGAAFPNWSAAASAAAHCLKDLGESDGL